MTRCPFCQAPGDGAVIAEAAWAPQAVLARIKRDNPQWRREDGACPACLQQFLLEVLLARGEEGLHETIQDVWPLDSEAAYGALPTPLRMHADPHYTGRGTTLAMVDSAFFPHPDLTEPVNRIKAWVNAAADPPEEHFFTSEQTPRWKGWDDGRAIQWHGLMTSVVAAGNGARSHGLYRGLASGAGLVLVQVSNNRGHISDGAIRRALRWLKKNAGRLNLRVVNLSVVGDSGPSPDNPIDRAASDLVRMGVVVVAAAGNDGVRRLYPPSTCPDAITVGGLDDNNSLDHGQRRVWHSNYGESTIGALKPELVAPSIWVVGPLLPSTNEHHQASNLFFLSSVGDSAAEREIVEKKLVSPHYKLVEGTSFAAPIVASTVACMLEANPALTPDLVRQCLAAACHRVPGAPVEQQGLGAIDSGQAVAFALRAKGGVLEGFSLSPDVRPNETVFLLRNLQAERVEVFGSWNGWTKPVEAFPVAAGVWRASGPALKPGKYHYKFLINERHWMDDPSNPRKAPDGHGGFNSIIVVGRG
jgi:serine protease AprX